MHPSWKCDDLRCVVDHSFCHSSTRRSVADVHRLARSGLALVVGFGLSTIAIEVGHAFQQKEASGVKLGSLDFRKFCEKVYGERASAVSVRPDAFGWRCGATPNGIYASYDIEVNKACTVLYSQTAHAKTYDPAYPYSWECFRGPG